MRLIIIITSSNRGQRLAGDNVVCICGCGEPLPARARKYATTRCRERVKARRRRAKERAQHPSNQRPGAQKPVVVDLPINHDFTTVDESLDGRTSARAGDGYARFAESGLLGLVASGAISRSAAAREFGTNEANVSRWLVNRNRELQTAKKRSGWQPPPLIQLPDKALWDGRSDPEIDPDLPNTDPYWRAVESVVDQFAAFRARYFIVPETGRPYETPPHQRRWFRRVFHTYIQGSRSAIVATPRHGKTEGFRDFDVFVITRVNPNVRIIHIGGNEDIAKDFVQSVLDILENNEKLIRDICGEGGSFKPGTKTGKTWAKNKLTVATRTATGMKSPTLIAVGRGGRLPSRDADIVQFDDIEDTDSTAQPGARAQTRRWFVVDLSSRKEGHTAMLGIGQRVHVEDLLGHLQENPEWTVITDVAHDEELCTVDEPDERTNWNKHTGCMLWPEKNDYEWLMSCLNNALMEDGTRATFDMVYLGKVDDTDRTTFPKAVIEDCFNRSRVIGDRASLPPGCRLIAGIDPARSGYQAAVLWAYTDTGTMYLLDLENEQAGGLEHLRDVIRRWYKKYDLTEWVYEVNGAQREWIRDREIVQLKASGIFIAEHTTTGATKNDNTYGVTAMAPWFREGKIDLPYGDEASRRKVNAYASQLRNFSLRATGHHWSWKTDLVMAGWFPFKKIKTARLSAEISTDVQDDTAGWMVPDDSWLNPSDAEGWLNSA